jgi:hypothetical protein
MADDVVRKIAVVQYHTEKECKYYKCAYILKYEKIMELAVSGMVRAYCKGSKMTECKRRIYRERFGRFPTDDTMPNGDKIITAIKSTYPTKE